MLEYLDKFKGFNDPSLDPEALVVSETLERLDEFGECISELAWSIFLTFVTSSFFELERELGEHETDETDENVKGSK